MSMHVQAQRGSILIYILIAVALFATLSYVVAQMMRGGAGEVSQEKAGLLADDIMSYGQALRRGIQPMRISNGCEDTDISFEVAGLAGYANGTNAKCQIFSPSGGGITYVRPSVEMNNAADWIFTGSNLADQVGTIAPDLIAVLPDIALGICNAINRKLGITATGNDANMDFSKFQGTYATVSQTFDFADGKAAGCLNYANSGDHYFFYQVLIGR